MENQTQLRRPWFRFGLGSFLLFVTLICVWLGWQINAARRQRDIVSAIEKIHGSVKYDYQAGPNKPRVHWLVEYLGVDFFHHVSAVWLDGPNDEHECRSILRRLDKLPNLRLLVVNNCTLEDDDLRCLSNLSSLETLNLAQNSIDGCGFVFLRNLQIDSLRLDNNPITDDGLKDITQLKSVNVLSLGSTNITDACIPTLANARQLKVVNVDATQLTLPEIKRLHDLRPDLKIAHEPPIN